MKRTVIVCLVHFIFVLIVYNEILHKIVLVSQDGSLDFVKVWQKVQTCYDDIRKTRNEHSNDQTFEFIK